MTSDEKLFTLSNSVISGLHNEAMAWLKVYATGGKPATLEEAKELIIAMASNQGAELDDEAVEIWCYETAEDNPDLIQC